MICSSIRNTHKKIKKRMRLRHEQTDTKIRNQEVLCLKKKLDLLDPKIDL